MITTIPDSTDDDDPRTTPTASCFVLLWCTADPSRVGEVAIASDGRRGGVLGRGDDGRDILAFARQRPGSVEPTGALSNPRVSRRQAEITDVEGGRCRIRNVGKAELLHNGRVVDEATLAPGDAVAFGSGVVLLWTSRPAWLPADVDVTHPFGRADDDGIVGESPAAWRLRAAIAAAARGEHHVLVHGPSGVGKELVARAIARRAARGGEIVSRNAATLPEGLLDAELFGNVKNYPHAGMPARPGLIGQAQGGTVFLDEIGELPAAAQAHLLRVLDAGEYQRLGDARAQRSDARFVVATNRAPTALKHDFAARFVERVEVPGLDGRPEDVPLLAQHWARRRAANDPTFRGRFIGADGALRATPELVRRLAQRSYATHARELVALLEAAAAASPGTRLEAHDALPEPRPSAPMRDPDSVTAAELESALAAAGGSIERAWRSLGLASRHVLRRLMQKHGVSRPGGAA